MQRTIEYPKGTGVRIRPVVNKTNGTTFGESFIVNIPAKVSGAGRQRKQFDTLDKAKEHAAQIVNGVRAIGEKFIDLEHVDRDATLRLLDALKERGGQAQDAVDDVIAALKAIGASPLRLTECVTFALPRLAPSKVVTVAEAAESLLAAKEGQVTPEFQRTTRIYLSRVTAKFGLLPISHLDAVKINELVAGLKKRDRKGADGETIPGKAASPKYRSHVLGATRRLVRHAISRGWLAKGVVDFELLDVPRKRGGGAIEIYSPKEMAALLKHATEADAELVPFLAIGAFAGLRSAEIERLDWREIDLVAGHIEVTAAKSKTASRRLAPIADNLKLWLSPLHKKDGGRVFAASTTAGNFTTRVQTLAKGAGLARWKKNALRHSFISYRVAAIQNVAQVAMEAGNSPAMIFSNYRELVKPADAAKWFGLVPALAANVTPILAVA